MVQERDILDLSKCLDIFSMKALWPTDSLLHGPQAQLSGKDSYFVSVSHKTQTLFKLDRSEICRVVSQPQAVEQQATGAAVRAEDPESLETQSAWWLF